LRDAGVDPLDARVAEQADVAALAAADDHLVLAQDQLAARPEARLHLDPRLLEDHLRQPDQQADAQAQRHEAPGAGPEQFRAAARRCTRRRPSPKTRRRMVPATRPRAPPGTPLTSLRTPRAAPPPRPTRYASSYSPIGTPISRPVTVQPITVTRICNTSESM